jgi:hypothetical protein
MEWDAFSGSILENQDSSIYDLDYVRYRTFELCADEMLTSMDPQTGKLLSPKSAFIEETLLRLSTASYPTSSFTSSTRSVGSRIESTRKIIPPKGRMPPI